MGSMSENLVEWMDETRKRPHPVVNMASMIVQAFPSILDFEDDDELLQTYAAMRMQVCVRGHAGRKRGMQRRESETAKSPAKWAQPSRESSPERLKAEPGRTVPSMESEEIKASPRRETPTGVHVGELEGEQGD